MVDSGANFDQTRLSFVAQRSTCKFSPVSCDLGNVMFFDRGIVVLLTAHPLERRIRGASRLDYPSNSLNHGFKAPRHVNILFAYLSTHTGISSAVGTTFVLFAVGITRHVPHEISLTQTPYSHAHLSVGPCGPQIRHLPSQNNGNPCSDGMIEVLCPVLWLATNYLLGMKSSCGQHLNWQTGQGALLAWSANRTAQNVIEATLFKSTSISANRESGF